MTMEWVFQLALTTIVGALAWFVKSAIAEMRDGNKQTAQRVSAMEKELANMKADFPMVYVLREDFIRSMNSVEASMKRTEDKLDTLIQRVGRRSTDG